MRRIHAVVLQEFDALVASGVPIAEAGRRVRISEKSARRRVGETRPPGHQPRLDRLALTAELAKVMPCVAHGCLRMAEVPSKGVCHAHYKKLRAHSGRYEPANAARMVGDRTCTRCAKILPVTEFALQSNVPGGRSAVCKPCKNEYKRARGNLRWRQYGLTEQQYDEMVAACGGRCEICGEVPSGERPVLHIDHCHDIGVVRGLLCRGCNTALGHMKDDPDRLVAAAAYLRRAR